MFGPAALNTIETGVIPVGLATPRLRMAQVRTHLGRATIDAPPEDPAGPEYIAPTGVELIVFQADARTAEKYLADPSQAMLLPEAQVFYRPIANGQSIVLPFAIASPGMPYSGLVRLFDGPMPE